MPVTSNGCPCGGTDTWYDRSICPPPCDTQHERCQQCGFAIGWCAQEDDPDSPDGYVPPWGLPVHMSPSQINSLLTCGEQYRLERVVRVPSRPMWAGVGGTTVHKLTEELDLEEWRKKHGEAEPG